MTYNDILRRVRYALNITDPQMIEIFALSGHSINADQLGSLLAKEGEPGYSECSAMDMGKFLDGLIVYKRGRKDTDAGLPQKREACLTNNAMLKKLRIALELKEEDMLNILKSAGVIISKHELSAIFRKEGHKNYKECGDQFMRNFLKGLSIRFRPV